MTTPPQLQNAPVLVVGAGTMGAGIAQVAAQAGHVVMLYDAREGSYREVATTAPMTMGGVMNYVSIDVGNLKRWFAGTIGATGTLALNSNGYIVYFSDRRGNHE